MGDIEEIGSDDEEVIAFEDDEQGDDFSGGANKGDKNSSLPLESGMVIKEMEFPQHDPEEDEQLVQNEIQKAAEEFQEEKNDEDEHSDDEAEEKEDEDPSSVTPDWTTFSEVNAENSPQEFVSD